MINWSAIVMMSAVTPYTMNSIDWINNKEGIIMKDTNVKCMGAGKLINL